MRTLFRTFFAQFFTSETVTSDIQLRQAMIGVLAFVLTPCLMLLQRGFGQFQQLTYHATVVPPAVIIRLNAVRALAFDDLIEAVVAVLVAYSMIIVGLVAVYAWEALTFDRCDAMVLGPLPLRPATIITAKLAALGALLLGAALGVSAFNSFLFALHSADRIGFAAFVVNFFACLVVTMAASILVFSTVVIVRGLAVTLGGPRFATYIGSACQLLLVVVLLELLVSTFATPHVRGQLSVPETTTPPLTWFVAWFEVLRGSTRGHWPEVIAIARSAIVLVPAAACGALLMSIVTFRYQMRRALTPSAAIGRIGQARLARAVARRLCLRDGFACAVSDFVLTTIVRSRAQQTPIAINLGIGVALVAVSLVRQPTGSSTLLAAPLVLAYWMVVGLRAAFFVPSELPAAWTFTANAPLRFPSYARGVRAAIVALVAPLAGIAALILGGWPHAIRSVLLVVVLADLVVLTITFVPFSRPYRPGHAKLKMRWPLYLAGSYASAYLFQHLPIALIVMSTAALEPAIARFARRRWGFIPRADEVADDSLVTTLDLIGSPHVESDATPDESQEFRRPFGSGTLADVRYAFRLLGRERSFSMLVVSTMALAIGANVALFTIVNGMGGRPKIANETRAVVVGTVDRAGHPNGVSYLDFLDWQSRTRTIAQMAAYRGVGVNLTGGGLSAERATGAYVTAQLFQLIGERPILGRDFLLSDDVPGAAPVAILGGGLWKTRYGADPKIVGRTIRANGVDVTVVGVMRPGFRFPLIHDMWMPLASATDILRERRNVRTLQVVARLRDGASPQQARAEFTELGAALSREYPDTNRDIRPAVSAYSEQFTIANPWTAMLCAVSFVLIIGCANIANLLLARGARRANELAIRRSLGATRWQLIRQLLVEHSILAAIAGALGLAVGYIGVRVWVDALPVADWPYWYDFTPGRQAFGYFCVIVVACALLFGVGPAIVTSRLVPAARPSRLWTNGLLTIEITLTLALLAGAVLLSKTLASVYRADSVVDTADVVMAGIDLPQQRYRTPEQRLVAYRGLEDRLADSPDVEAAALASVSPFYSAPPWLVEVEGQHNALSPIGALYVAIGPRYFETLHLALPRGRVFTADDGRPGHETVIVNERFVAMYLQGADPLGRRIKISDPRNPAESQRWLTIVGVSPTVRQHDARDFDPVIYVPYGLNPAATMIVLARPTRTGPPIATTLRSALAATDPELPLVNVMPLDQLLAGTRFANEVFATMFGTFAAIALLLAAIGLHAITAYAVTQRTREIGIRVALGAGRSTVTWMFVRHTLPAIIAGLVLGTAASLGVGQVVRGILAGTSPRDPVALAAISIILVAVALVSTVVPARRAATLDPAAALRRD